MSKVTDRLIEQYHRTERARDEALSEVLCSAYKDATGVYPNDRLRDKIFDAVEYDS